MKKLFIFGSTGDLVKRKVLLGLHNFKDLEVHALGRKDLSKNEYAHDYCINCSTDFKERLNYIKIDFNINMVNYFKQALDKKNVNYFYISLPPNLISGILLKLNAIRKEGYKIQILIEKPFGSNLQEALMLKDLIKKLKLDKNVYLADHYLFKKSILNLKAKDFRELRIVVLEKLGLENRAYYDDIGALRDMTQSHFFNILFKISKELINSDILENFKILEFKKGQYNKYEEELGKKSDTETYIKLKFGLGHRIIEFETGKAFGKKEAFIQIDGKKMYIDVNENPYIKMFQEFFKNKKSNFPKIEEAILSWELINKIETFEKNKDLITY
jgi:glucose-6-phosphate 1-dehydrogenase